MMDWVIAIVAIAVVVLLFLGLRPAFVPEAEARKHLAAGALVIDVRSEREFQGGHIPGAVNVPWSEVRDRVPELVKDRSRPLLVHCLSGGRSAIARRQLIGMGYVNVFNLGSLKRAGEIVSM